MFNSGVGFLKSADFLSSKARPRYDLGIILSSMYNVGPRYLTRKNGLYVVSLWIKRKSIISPRRCIADRKSFRLIRLQDVEIEKPFVLIKEKL